MFKNSEIQEFQNDRINIPAITGKKLNVFVIALASFEYFKNYGKYGKHDILSKPNIDACISWKQMSELYHRKIYSEADSKYNS